MGLNNLTALWHRLRDSLWFVPALLTFGSAVLAVITIQLDVAGILPEAPAGVWLFSGTASGARGVLSAIASGFITVTGVVFSVTIVALQLASTQFTPRILRNFTADRANQVVLGVFIATFTYALLVLRVVRGEQGGLTPEQAGNPAASAMEPASQAFVPNLSVTIAVALAVLSIGFLIFFIDHAARSIQASVIIDRVTEDTLETLHRSIGKGLATPSDGGAEPRTPRGQGTVVTTEKSGYIQGVDEDDLLELVADEDMIVRVEPDVGDFLLPGDGLATVWPAGFGDETRVAEGIRKAFVLGAQRTPHLDVEFGLIELVDMAVKALSPGINDPTTAVLCVDRIAEILLEFGRREVSDRVRRREGGSGTLILPRPRFDSLVRLSIDQIRHFGAGNPHFAETLLDRLHHLGALLPAHQRAVVARSAAATLRDARLQIEEPSDMSRVERAARTTLEGLGAGTEN